MLGALDSLVCRAPQRPSWLIHTPSNSEQGHQVDFHGGYSGNSHRRVLARLYPVASAQNRLFFLRDQNSTRQRGTAQHRVTFLLAISTNQCEDSTVKCSSAMLARLSYLLDRYAGRDATHATSRCPVSPVSFSCLGSPCAPHMRPDCSMVPCHASFLLLQVASLVGNDKAKPHSQMHFEFRLHPPSCSPRRKTPWRTSVLPWLPE